MMGILEKRRNQMTEAVQSQMQPGEQVRVIVPVGQGFNPYAFGLLGGVGALILANRGGYFSLAVTDRAIYFGRRNWTGGRIIRTDRFDLNQVNLVSSKFGKLWCKLQVQRPDKTMKLWVSRARLKSDAEALAAALAPSPQAAAG